MPTHVTASDYTHRLLNACGILTKSSGKTSEAQLHKADQCEDVCLNCTKDECNGNRPMIRKAKKERKDQK